MIYIYICILRKYIHYCLKMFNAVQPKTPEAVLAALTQYGAAIGPK